MVRGAVAIYHLIYPVLTLHRMQKVRRIKGSAATGWGPAAAGPSVLHCKKESEKYIVRDTYNAQVFFYDSLYWGLQIETWSLLGLCRDRLIAQADILPTSFLSYS